MSNNGNHKKKTQGTVKKDPTPNISCTCPPSPAVPFADAIKSKDEALQLTAALAAGYPTSEAMQEHLAALESPQQRILFNYAAISADPKLREYLVTHAKTVKLATSDYKELVHCCKHWVPAVLKRCLTEPRTSLCPFAVAPHCCYGYAILGKCPYVHPYDKEREGVLAQLLIADNYKCPAKLHIRFWNPSDPTSRSVLGPAHKYHNTVFLMAANRDQPLPMILEATDEELQLEMLDDLEYRHAAHQARLSTHERYTDFGHVQASSRSKREVLAAKTEHLDSRQQPQRKRPRDDHRERHDPR